MRLQSSTILMVGAGAAAWLACFALTRGDRETPLPPLPPTPPPPPPPPPLPALPAHTIPSHHVSVTPSSTSSAEVDQMVRELTRPAQTHATAAAPAAEVDQMVRELTQPKMSFQRSPRQAATDLFNYVTQAIRGGKLEALGSKATPSDYIANAQRDMKLVASDGIYGPKTAARGKELLGREFPSRTPSPKKRVQSIPATVIDAVPAPTAALLALPPPEPPSMSMAVPKVSPREAAAALFELVTHPPVNWGSKAKPNMLIRDAQRDMGGITADGIYGPKTQARGKLLLGKAFPARK